MPYIGNDIRSNEDYKIIDDISSGFNGSETSFALQVSGSAPVPFPKLAQQLLISVNGVVQEPDPTGSTGFKISGTNIVFSSAPTGGHAFFGVIYAGADYLNAGGTFPSGEESVPSIGFSNDTDTGIFSPSSGAVAITSNGTKIAQFPTSQGSSGQSLVTDGAGVLSFSSPAASTVTVADESSDTTCFPLFVTAATGNLSAKSGSNLAFNSSSGLLTATEFSGSGASLTSLNGSNISSGTIAAARVATLNQNTTGSAATLTTARNIGGVSFDGSASINLPGVNTAGNQDTSGTAAIATTVTVADESSDTSCNILFATAATGNLAPKSGTNLTFNSSNGTLTATLFSGSFSGSGSGLTNIPAGQLTGTVADARISTLTASKLTGALPAIDGSNLTGVAAGAQGGGTDEVFYENGQTVTTDYTITNGKNAGSFGPITINNGATVTVGSGENLIIV